MPLNPAQPLAGTRLCALDEIAEPGAKGFVFREGDMLFLGFVVRKDGAVFGYLDRCPHAGLPLAPFPDRYLTREGDLVLCGSHGALFRIGDGLCVAGPCAGRRLWPWPVRAEAGEVLAG
ncbi:MAG: Rieske (2Fe-2S) protein [Caulobacteraceae bacterium]